jgi:hypothetical protein
MAPIDQPDPSLPWPLLERRQDPAKTFLSLMVLVALTLVGLVVGTQLHRAVAGTVRCELSGGSPGAAVQVDGRDVGLRMGAGPTPLRLPAGRHTVGLRVHGAPPRVREVDVLDASACRVSFDGEQ